MRLPRPELVNHPDPATVLRGARHFDSPGDPVPHRRSIDAPPLARRAAARDLVVPLQRGAAPATTHSATSANIVRAAPAGVDGMGRQKGDNL